MLLIIYGRYLQALECRGGKIAQDIAAGLIYLHSLGIAHLDIKSPNILFMHGVAKIADVGLGKVVHPGRNPMATHPGTFLYAPPEQLLGRECGFFSDMWSFGTVLWEICMGQPPRMRLLETLDPGRAPASIVDLIDRCLREDSAMRPTAQQAFDIITASLEA